MEDLVGARLLDCHALDANGDLKLLELLLGARFRLLHLLGKLQLPNGLLDHLNPFGLIHAQVTKELENENNDMPLNYFLNNFVVIAY